MMRIIHNLQNRISAKRRVFIYILLFAFCCLIPIICNQFQSGLYYLNVVNYIFVYAIAAMGLNIMTGYSGQINLGGAAYFAIGAYSTVVISNYGVPQFPCVLG